ncbi:Tbc1 Domain Family Member 22B [Manis pentadactyla]|nr:Tbc1 Domain Family Member 22B [Manis pentadactyla]
MQKKNKQQQHKTAFTGTERQVKTMTWYLGLGFQDDNTGLGHFRNEMTVSRAVDKLVAIVSDVAMTMT